MSKNSQKTVGDRVRECRKARKLSQKQLAALAGLRQPTISALERNKAQASKKIASIARVLEVNALWLETGADATHDEDVVQRTSVPEDALFVVKDPEGTVLLYTAATDASSSRAEFVRAHRLVWGQAAREGYKIATYFARLA